ncbi:MAG TPA: sigma-70 family RNA polymerase sigma factor [Acidimicrobiales bacterium]|nr:sigma-70 family RNA polymerase sigma factor [Acidimicrobiales bacterium]
MLGIDDLEFNRDRSLVERVQLGDEDAFAELYRRHHDRLYRYCLYRLGEAHEAQDVVQEAFTRAWVSAGRLQGDLRFYPWLRTIAGNLCTDVGRRRARVQPAPAVDTGSTEGGQEQIIDRVDLTLLEQAMSRLPERHRQILEMREAEGLTYEQLADQTGTTVGSVESLLWRARQGLRRQFAVVSGEGLLAGLPVVGWLIRRSHAAHARVTAQLVDWRPEAVSALGTAIGGLAVGSVVAVALVAGGTAGSGGGHGPVAVGAGPAASAPATTSALLQFAAQPAAPPAASGNPSAAQTHRVSTPPSSTRATPGRTEFTNPVVTNRAQAQSEAAHDPMAVSVAGLTLGLDPQATTTYVIGLVQSHAVIP